MSISSRTQGSTGNVHFQQLVSAQLLRLGKQIPATYHLPHPLLENPPLNVASIPETCGILSEEELAVTELDATAVLEKIASGLISAVAVVTAFGKRAAIAHQLTACLTDFFLDEGIQRAEELDAYLKAHGKTVGPLHGLPISLKDLIPVKGRWGTGGFLSNLEVSPEDCYLVTILRDLGAVFYVKTNQPQSIMHLETHSFYGRTLNPFNLDLSPGGSSGGESALLAMKGSCMGVGTDIGGSIRSPCASTGQYGIRPTSSTFPFGRGIWYTLGNDGVLGTAGPMCRSARDLKLLIQSLHSQEPWLKDPSLLPIPLEIPEIGRMSREKLRVGIMISDGVVMPHPPLLRALNVAKEKLQASMRVDAVEYVPYKHQEGVDIINMLYFDDGGETIRRLLKEGGEDMLPLTEWATNPLHTKDLSASQAWELRHKRDRFRHAYLQYWREKHIDVLLSPAYPAVAPRHDTARYWGYTSIWNLLDWPGAVFPTGLVVDPTIDLLDPKLTQLSPVDEYYRQLYEPKAFAGLPISLQVTAPRFRDGLVLAAVDFIERIFKGQVTFV